MKNHQTPSMRSRLAVLLACMALVAAACGDDTTSTTSLIDEVEPTVVEEAASDESVQSQDVVSEVTAAETVVVDERAEVVDTESNEDSPDEPAPEEIPIEEPVVEDTDITTTTMLELTDSDPWVRVMSEEVPAAELWPAGDPDGNPYPDDLVCQYADDLECYYIPSGSEQEQPESEETSQPVVPVEETSTSETTPLPEEPVNQESVGATTTTIPTPTGDHPWVRVVNEPVPASELWPEGDENGETYPDDLFCHVPSGGDLECYYTTPEPEPEQPQEPTSPSDTTWTPPVAGMVPEVHPDVPLAEWQRGTVDPLDRANDKARTTVEVQQWRDWCYPRWNSCEWAEHNMYQALDYLGAHEQCVLNEYTKKVEYFLREGSGANNSYGAENFGWHRCSTVIDPLVGDFSAGGRDNDIGLRLSDTQGITLAERCRIVLTGPFPNIELETRWTVGGTPPTEFGQDCDAWAAYIETRSSFAGSPSCTSSRSLAQEWMEHNHGQHERYHSPFC